MRTRIASALIVVVLSVAAGCAGTPPHDHLKNCCQQFDPNRTFKEWVEKCDPKKA